MTVLYTQRVSRDSFTDIAQRLLLFHLPPHHPYPSQFHNFRRAIVKSFYLHALVMLKLAPTLMQPFPPNEQTKAEGVSLCDMHPKPKYIALTERKETIASVIASP